MTKKMETQMETEIMWGAAGFMDDSQKHVWIGSLYTSITGNYKLAQGATYLSIPCPCWLGLAGTSSQITTHYCDPS